MTSLLTKNAFFMRVPARKPQVSRLLVVFLCAIRRKVVRRVVGRKTFLSAVPFSRHAVDEKTRSSLGVSGLLGGLMATSSTIFDGRAGV